MLRPGRYKSEHDGNVFQAYRYVMEVKETAKSYIFKLLEVENRYADDHIEIMFGGKKRIVLPKDRKSNSQSGGVFVAEVERITAWARREYAESNIHTYRWYTDKEHRKPYYKRDYALVTITDPVAQQLEKLIALVSKKH